MRRDRKETIVFIIILLILSMGIGYAFLTTTLSIDGTSDIDSATWNVHWANIVVDQDSISGSQVITPATISADGQTVSFHINFKGPNEVYKFRVDAVNSGTLDAEIDQVIFKVNGDSSLALPVYLYQSLTYENATENVNEKQVLLAGETKQFYYRLYYEDIDNPSELPSSSESIDITIDLVYHQIKKTNTVYTSSMQIVTIGQQFPSNASAYADPGIFIEESREEAFLRHDLINDVVNSSYLGIYYYGNYYYLRGAGATYNSSANEYNNDSQYYENNKSIMSNVFGVDNCSESNVTNANIPFNAYTCLSMTGRLKVIADEKGNVVATQNLAYNHGVYSRGASFYDITWLN